MDRPGDRQGAGIPSAHRVHGVAALRGDGDAALRAVVRAALRSPELHRDRVLTLVKCQLCNSTKAITRCT